MYPAIWSGVTPRPYSVLYWCLLACFDIFFYNDIQLNQLLQVLQLKARIGQEQGAEYAVECQKLIYAGGSI